MTKTKIICEDRYTDCLGHLNFGHSVLPALLNIIALTSVVCFIHE